MYLHTILHKMVLVKTDKAAGGGETLRNHESYGDGEFLPLSVGPSVDILQQCRENSLLERSL